MGVEKLGEFPLLYFRVRVDYIIVYRGSCSSVRELGNEVEVVLLRYDLGVDESSCCGIGNLPVVSTKEFLCGPFVDYNIGEVDGLFLALIYCFDALLDLYFFDDLDLARGAAISEDDHLLWELLITFLVVV